MYRVRIYAADPGSKSGRRKINKNSQGGKTAKEAAEFVAKAIASVPEENAAKIVRILIETESESSGSDDLKLSFDAPKSKAESNGAAATPKKTASKSAK